MKPPISSIKGLGPAMELAFAKVGITDAESLRSIGADKAYAQLLSQGTRPHFIAYYALVMALQGRPWNDCKGDEKDALRSQFDALKADTKPKKDPDGLPTELAKFLNDTGIKARRS